MGTVAVDVKWQKEIYKGVEIDMSQPPLVFKNQLFSLTGALPSEAAVFGQCQELLLADICPASQQFDSSCCLERRLYASCAMPHCGYKSAER